MKARGLALAELLLVIGVVCAIATAVISFAWSVDGTRQVDRAAEELAELVRVIDAGNGSTLGHTSGLSAAKLASEGTAPLAMIDGASLRSHWGPVLVEPLTLDPRRPHAHVRITYQGIPSNHCSDLVVAFKGVAVGLQVNGRPVLDHLALDRAALLQACQQEPATITIDHDTGGGGNASLL